MGRRIRCSECGAQISVPPAGLTMSCEYCGFSQSVPDADKRRKRMEREEAKRLKAQERARREAEKKQQQEASQSKARRGAVFSAITMLLWFLISAAIVGTILYHTGRLDALIGDTGSRHLAEVVHKLRSQGYRSVTPTRTERLFSSSTEMYLDLEQERCYALAIGAGRRITRVQLSGRPSIHQEPLRFSDVLYYCSGKDEVRKVSVTIDRPGRISWALFVAKPRSKRPEVRPDDKEEPGAATVSYRWRCTVRAEPSRKSKKLGVAKSKVVYQVLDREGKRWHKIRLSNGVEGWTGCRPRY